MQSTSSASLAVELVFPRCTGSNAAQLAAGADRRARRFAPGAPAAQRPKSLAGLPPLDEQSHPTRRATGIRARGSTSRSSRTPCDDYRLRAWSTSYGSFTRRSDRAACCSTSILFPGIRGLRSGAADAELLWATSTTRWASTRSARRARVSRPSCERYCFRWELAVGSIGASTFERRGVAPSSGGAQLDERHPDGTVAARAPRDAHTREHARHR